MPIRTAMILAAGRGERLRPLTDQTPKPLIRIDGRNLIERHLETLANADYNRVIINIAHLGDQIVDAIERMPTHGIDIRISHEPEGALETAGGIARALDLISDEMFLALNGDIAIETDLASFSLPESSEMHLLLVDNPPHHPDGDFCLDRESGRLNLPGSSSAPTRTFSGIGCYRAGLFQRLPEQRYPLAPLIKRCIERGTATGAPLEGAWFDIGTADRLTAARQYFGDPTTPDQA